MKSMTFSRSACSSTSMGVAVSPKHVTGPVFTLSRDAHIAIDVAAFVDSTLGSRVSSLPV